MVMPEGVVKGVKFIVKSGKAATIRCIRMGQNLSKGDQTGNREGGLGRPFGRGELMKRKEAVPVSFGKAATTRPGSKKKANFGRLRSKRNGIDREKGEATHTGGGVGKRKGGEKLTIAVAKEKGVSKRGQSGEKKNTQTR